MRIVHIEDFFHPDAGYQVNLLSKIQVEQGHEVIVVTSELKRMPEYLTGFFGKENIVERDIEFERITGVRIIRIPLLAYISGRSIYKMSIFRIVDSLEPTVIFVHGEDTMIGIQFIFRSFWQKYPMILDCHMLEMASENSFKFLFRFFYRKFVTPVIIKNNIPLIRVVDSDYVEKCLGLPLNRTRLLSFGTDVGWFKPNDELRLKFREEHDIRVSDFVVCYAGKLDEYKGGLFLAKSIKEKLELDRGRNIVFIIVGNTVGEYGREVDRLLQESENRVLRFPTQPYLGLANFYQASDIAVFGKQCSLSFFEVQSCGLPVLFEENEINVQRIKGANCRLFEPSSSDSFRDGVRYFASMSNEKLAQARMDSRDFVLSEYNYLPVANEFTKILEQAVNQFNHS